MGSPKTLDQLHTLHLEMGMQCNARCSMCFQTDFSPASVMPECIWKEKLRPAYAVARELLIIGGEPTVMSNCRSLLDLVVRDYPSLALITSTNGILFNGVWEDAFLQQGKVVNFSVIAIDPARYNRIVRHGNRALVLENLLRLVRRKRDAGSALTIRMSTVITDDTLDELSGFMEWGATNGVDQVSLDPDCVGFVRRSPRDVQEQISKAYAAADRHPETPLLRLKDFDRMYAVRFHIPPVRTLADPSVLPAPCQEAFHTLLIAPDGAAKPCCLSWYLYGNLRETGWREVWNSGAAQVFRRRIREGNYHDCFVGCTYNQAPIGRRLSSLRQGLWALRRNPRTAARKILHKMRWSFPH